VIERILAPNPGLYTGPGTNTYLMRSAGEVLIVDPGPVIEAHAVAIRSAIGGDTAVGVIVTHTHPDHAPLANPLARLLGVAAMGFGPGPEFTPDVRIADGGTIVYGTEAVTAIHTPGHTPDHLCFRRGEVLLTGDHIIEGSTVVIDDATDYLESLYRVSELDITRIEPGHGNAIDDAGAAITSYIEHRLDRERQLLAAIRAGTATVGDLVDAVYEGIPEGLRDAAAHQVRVQLTKLSRDGAVWFVDDRTELARVRLR
jgi:glyoxylase-like metal-dependent hydrolase (beta-lactamase superfamily II)